MKVSQLKPARQARDEDYRHDAEYRAEWDRTAFAREIAVAVVQYRAERGMSQRDLARATGLTQPVIARLESGDSAPSLATLVKLTTSPGLRLRLEMDAGSVKVA